MKCVVLQPSYVPWRGYFHQIAKADCFVFYDDVQYDKHGWRNRNRIKTAQGSQWLTIPVYASGAPVDASSQDFSCCSASKRAWRRRIAAIPWAS